MREYSLPSILVFFLVVLVFDHCCLQAKKNVALILLHFRERVVGFQKFICESVAKKPIFERTQNRILRYRFGILNKYFRDVDAYLIGKHKQNYLLYNSRAKVSGRCFAVDSDGFFFGIVVESLGNSHSILPYYSHDLAVAAHVLPIETTGILQSQGKSFTIHFTTEVNSDQNLEVFLAPENFPGFLPIKIGTILAHQKSRFVLTGTFSSRKTNPSWLKILCG
ncbi:MAG: hypothetical protein NZT61_06535 [Deltaproteobacteria bacterium]|nr:hypothetical protein [Deltaproteobacteria bacterium]MCX7953205.1 hypothetical protein [Deltaproteobacteria bacterium]